MKYLFLFMAAAVIFSCGETDKNNTDTVTVEKELKVPSGSSADSTNLTTIEWIDQVDQNLGTLNKGQVVEITWKFKNSGNKPLIIEDVRPGCGCTVAEKPNEPIAPGGEGVIKAKYDSESGVGTIRKEMSVLANNSNRNNGHDNKLSFTAEVKD